MLPNLNVSELKKVKGGDFNDVLSKVKGVASTVGDVVKTAATVTPYVLPLVGLGKDQKKARKPSEWNTLVSKDRKEKGISLKDAMKYISEHNLYQKKTKSGGSARFPLSQESVDANLKEAMPSTMQTTGNVKSLKFN